MVPPIVSILGDRRYGLARRYRLEARELARNWNEGVAKRAPCDAKFVSQQPELTGGALGRALRASAARSDRRIEGGHCCSGCWLPRPEPCTERWRSPMWTGTRCGHGRGPLLEPG
jgi:hypothetical protein